MRIIDKMNFLEYFITDLKNIDDADTMRLKALHAAEKEMIILSQLWKAGHGMDNHCRGGTHDNHI